MTAWLRILTIGVFPLPVETFCSCILKFYKFRRSKVLVLSIFLTHQFSELWTSFEAVKCCCPFLVFSSSFFLIFNIICPFSSFVFIFPEFSPLFYFSSFFFLLFFSLSPYTLFTDQSLTKLFTHQLSHPTCALFLFIILILHICSPNKTNRIQK